MMSLLLLAMGQAATASPLGPIGRQALPAKGCAAFLWSLADRQVVAMALVDPAQLRLSLDGRTIDVARTTQSGDGGYGFAGVTQYRGSDVTATMDLTIKDRAGLSGGATVPEATLTIDRPGKDTIIVPAAGLIGCSEGK